MSSVPLFLSLPGPRGYQAATVSLNTEQMLEAIQRGHGEGRAGSGGENSAGLGFPSGGITYSAMT